jgi:hypothetical protein
LTVQQHHNGGILGTYLEAINQPMCRWIWRLESSEIREALGDSKKVSREILQEANIDPERRMSLRGISWRWSSRRLLGGR